MDEPEKIYKAMHDLESLTRQYIDGILQSKESADSHARMLTAILDSIGDGLIVIDQDKKIILANKAAIRMAGWEISKLTIGELRERYKYYKADGYTLIPEEEQPVSIALKAGIANEVIGFVTSAHLPPEGLWIRAMAAPVKNDNNKIIGAVSIFQDVTKSIKLKNQRDALATLITHDLKNHLIAESGVLEVLADEIKDSVNPEIRDMLSEQVASNYRYLEIASTLVELCRTEFLSAKDSISTIPISNLINSVIALNGHHASNNNVSIVQNIEPNLPPLTGVLPALQQIFHNLIQNAIFVSESGETVTINAHRKDNSIIVEIADTGPGIPADKLAKLFDPTTVATHLKTGASSTGVGLHLCRLLLEAHGGKLTCSSVENEGTSFFVELPI